MKENDEEDIIQNKEGDQIINEKDLDNISDKNKKNKLLPSIDSIIEVEDKNKLKSMNTILREGSDEDIDTSNITEEEEIEYESSIPTFIYNAKNYVFIFFLLIFFYLQIVLKYMH